MSDSRTENTPASASDGATRCNKVWPVTSKTLPERPTRARSTNATAIVGCAAIEGEGDGRPTIPPMRNPTSVAARRAWR